MHKNYYQRTTCRLCEGTNLVKVLPLTPTALCDAYVTSEHVKEIQEVYPLDLFLCRDCGYAHVPYVVDPTIIYRDYIYVTTSSLGLSKHFQTYVDEVLHKIKPLENSLIIDVGSNDGTLLKCFKDRGMRTLGIDPAIEIARQATEAGIETLPEFFTLQLADKIRNDHGPATIVTMNNLFANIDNLIEVTKGIKKLLAWNGVFIVESFYIADLIHNMVFDFIYHEHLSAFSVKPLVSFFNRLGMELYDIDRIPTKGGSLRYYVQLKGGPRSVSPVVAELIEYENRLGLDRVEIYQVFSEKINERKDQLVSVLRDLKRQGKRIAGYGASATTTTFVYHFGIHDMLEYLVDDNPAKHYTCSPGYHIPVLPSDNIYERKPDYLVIIAWRYSEPIMKKQQAFLKQGGHFILPLPELKVI